MVYRDFFHLRHHADYSIDTTWGSYKLASYTTAEGRKFGALKVAVLRIGLIASFALRPSWSQAIPDDPYKVYISEQVCVWSMCWHQRSPSFSSIWGCYSDQLGRGVNIKSWISCVLSFFFLEISNLF